MYHYKYSYTYLSLIIFVLLFFQLSWVRRNDWHILSHGTRMFTKDDRFQVKIFCLFLLTQALSSQIVVFERKYFTIECQRYLFATFYSNKLKLVFQKIFQIFQIILMKQKYFGHDTGTNFNLGSTIRI